MSNNQAQSSDLVVYRLLYDSRQKSNMYQIAPRNNETVCITKSKLNLSRQNVPTVPLLKLLPSLSHDIRLGNIAGY